MLAEMCLAFAIYFESRSEPLQGQYYVAETIVNRVKSTKFPNDVCGVVLQPKQFTATWDRKQDFTDINQKAWDKAYNIALDVIRNPPVTSSVGCHYATLSTWREWMSDLEIVEVVGNHKFMEGGC